MYAETNTRVYKLRLIAVAALMVFFVILLTLLPSLIWTNPTAQAVSKPQNSIQNFSAQNSPNVITNGLFSLTDGVKKAAGGAQIAVYNGSQNFRLSVGAATVMGAHLVAHTTAKTVTFAAHTVGSSAEFVGHSTVKVVALAGNVTKLGSIITPAANNTLEQPTITNVPTASTLVHETPAFTNNLSKVAAPSLNISTPQWPIHGIVTLEFGVPHWPYQPIHTGMDISDAARSGVTPIHAFEPGIVIQVIQSNVGFGNHVVIDHGGGLDSLYGHMYSTAVNVGQKVDESTILGYEGTTGESTGVHVHFEIDLNGQPVDPRKYVSGQP